MHSLIDLGQVVALVLIDKENIPGLDVIKRLSMRNCLPPEME